MRFVYTKPRFITFPSTEKKKKKDSSFSLIHPRLKFSLTSPTLFSIKIAASEGREKFPSRGNPRFWGSIVDFYSKKKRKKNAKEYSKWRKRRTCVRASLLSSLSLLRWVRIGGKEAGNRISEKGKATRDAGCLYVARLYTHPRECDKLYEEAGAKG